MADEPSKSDLALKRIVDANTRYSGAYNEINTRITQRQHLITIFTAVVPAVIGAALKNFDLVGHAIWRLVYAIPFFVVMFATLLRMHERQIAILRAFISHLEVGSKGADIPDYHNASLFAKEAQRTRHPHDLMCFMLSLASLIPMGMIAYHAREEGLLTTHLEAGFLGVLMPTATLFSFSILGIRRMRTDLYKRLKSNPSL